MIITDTLFNLMMFIRIHVQCICTHNLICLYRYVGTPKPIGSLALQ